MSIVMTLSLCRSKVIENKHLNEKFHELTLKIESKNFDFEPGQFINLKVDKHIFRSYSIFSHPESLPYWKMFVDITPGGPGTTYISKLRKGDIIQTTKPTGFFVIQKNKNINTVILLATGCGLAPVKPMVEEMIKDKRLEINLFWGLRHDSEIGFMDLFKDWSKYPNFHFEIIISQPLKGWKGKVGHVMDLFPKINRKNLIHTSVYMAGNGSFVKESLSRLTNTGIPENNLYFEECYFTPL